MQESFKIVVQTRILEATDKDATYITNLALYMHANTTILSDRQLTPPAG